MSGNPLSRERGSERLRSRRRRRGRYALVALVVLLLLLVGVGIYGLWRPTVRVSQIAIVGGDPSLATVADAALAGSYFGIVPRDSIFFLPEQAIRTSILLKHPEIAAVSIKRTGLMSIAITLDERVAVARWCGASYDPSPATCYLFDGNGFIYSVATTTDATLDPFVLFAPISSSSTLGASVTSAAELPAAFDFARHVVDLGSPVIAVAITGDEADDYLGSGTRLVYVLGDEQNAYAALVSAGGDIDLSDGSIDYVDLRFDGKVYLKKK